MDILACACKNLRQASRIVTQLYDAALKPAKLKATQFTLLAILNKTGEIPVSKLAARMVIDRTTLSRNLNPLIEKGLIVSTTREDLRVHYVSLTTSGKAAVRKALPLWQQAQKHFIAGMGSNNWSNLISSLKQTVETLQKE